MWRILASVSKTDASYSSLASESILMRPLFIQGTALRAVAKAALVAFLLAEGCSGSDCLTLAQEYADEVHNYALGCDPAAANPCGDQLPTIVYEESPDGGLQLEALAANCTHAMNPARTARAKQILNKYLSSDCKTFTVPICMPISNRCSVQQPDGGWTCFD